MCCIIYISFGLYVFFFCLFSFETFYRLFFKSFKMIFEQCAVAHNRSSWIREYDCRLSVSTHCSVCFAFSQCFDWCAAATAVVVVFIVIVVAVAVVVSQFHAFVFFNCVYMEFFVCPTAIEQYHTQFTQYFPSGRLPLATVYSISVYYTYTWLESTVRIQFAKQM